MPRKKDPQEYLENIVWTPEDTLDLPRTKFKIGKGLLRRVDHRMLAIVQHLLETRQMQRERYHRRPKINSSNSRNA